MILAQVVKYIIPLSLVSILKRLGADITKEIKARQKQREEESNKKSRNYYRRKVLDAVAAFEKELREAANNGFNFVVDLDFIKNSDSLKLEE